MADNLTTQSATLATIPTATVIATDDVGGVHYQQVKLVDGTLNGTGAIGGDATNGLDVDVTRLPSGTVAGGTSLPAGTNNIGDVDVLTLPTLPAGTNAIGKLAANDAVDIGDVTVNNAAGASAVNVQDGGNSLTVDGSVAISGAVDTELTTADLDTGAGTDTRAVVGLVLAASGGGLLAGTANPVPVSDNAGSLTIDAPVGTPAAARLSDGTAFLTTTTGRLAVDPSGVTSPVSGTVTANQGTAGTAWEVVGDVAHDAVAPTNPVVVGAQMETMADSAPTTRSNADGDATKIATTDGAVYVIPTGPQTFAFHGTGVQTGVQVHAAPGAGLSCYITSISFSIGAATASSAKVLNNAGADIWGPHYLEAINGRGFHATFPTPLKATANTRLDVTTTGAATQTVDIEGFIAPG